MQTGKLIPLFTDDGYIIDDQTGEIIGTERDQQDLPFQPKTQADMEWLMGKLNEHDAEIAKLEAQRDAINKQIDKMEHYHQNAGKFLHFRYGQALIEYARHNLPKGKKTWHCVFGNVAFRSTRGSVEILNPDGAILWAEKECPQAVKVTKSILKSELKDVALPDDLFKLVPPAETVSIKSATNLLIKKED